MAHQWQMAVFDLDGLLVNTEMMHWRSYQEACRSAGVLMDWSFDSYFQTAGSSDIGVQRRLALEFPSLFSTISWHELYERKQKFLFELLQTESVPLMPGVERLLALGKCNNVLMACVTHSRAHFVDMIKKQHPIFASITAWYPRESYVHAKPAPDGYIKAVQDAGFLPEDVVGFEDSLRGLQAQESSGIQPVLVTQDVATQKAATHVSKALIFSTLNDVLSYTPIKKLFGA